MPTSNYKKLIEQGLRAGDTNIYEEDAVWSRYSNDKVDIGETLAKVIRYLSKEFPLNKELRAFSIGSSAEPQFRILETAFRDGLYLLDINKKALDVVNERIKRQRTDHVTTVIDDYNKTFLNAENTREFIKIFLHNKKVHLITFHHSLYYCEEEKWHTIFENIYRNILSAKGAIHTVLMASKSNDPHSTTWLYNHYAGKFFGHFNNQDLKQFKKELVRIPVYKNSQILLKTHKVYFSVNDFSRFMSVIWMILLYPKVHKYSDKQKEEITEDIYKKFWSARRPLVQEQDHMAIYRGFRHKGII